MCVERIIWRDRFIIYNEQLWRAEPGGGKYQYVVCNLGLRISTIYIQISPIPHNLCFPWLPHGGGGGIHPHHQKRNPDCLSQILFSTVPYTYIVNPNPKGQVSSFQTLELGPLKVQMRRGKNSKIKNL